MNQSGKCPAVAKAYKQKLEEIHISLQPFEKKSGGGGGCGDGSSAASTVSTLSTTSGVSSLSSGSNGLATPQQQDQYAEDMSTAFRALKHGGPSVNGRFEDALQFLSMSPAGYESSKGGGGKQLIRKPSLERELSGLRSPALDSGAGSSRSDSPHPPAARQYSPSGFGDPPPPPPPPRCSQSSTPPPPPPHVPYPPPNVQQLLKRMSPAPVVPQRGTSPVTTAGTASSGQRLGHQPMVVQNGFQAQQQLSQQIQALSMYQSGGGSSAGGGSVVSAGSSSAELPPPYPLGPPQPPPSYSSIYQSRQSPTQSQVSDYRKSPSSGVYSGPGSPSPVTTAVSSSPMVRPTPLQAWGARQAKTQPPIIMQSVKSTQVQKPVLQTAVAPTAPVTPVAQPPPPSYATSIQQKQQQHVPKPPTPVIPTASVPTTEPPSYATTMQALAAQRSHLPPPPPYGQPVDDAHHLRKCSIETIRSDSPPTPEIREAPLPPSGKQQIVNGTDGRPALPHKKIRHQSPIPERKHISKEKEEERRDCKVQNYSPQAFKFFMEQHIENVLKSYKQRVIRRVQLETEMAKIGLSLEAQCQMRKMLSQKESNYIRLKRAKMDKSMFTKIKPIGVGAFGEVTLVKKIDTNHLYAMKTLRKADVLKRNQVAHVKAERDILAEADNEWVVKLYYSFQDKDNLYFVMDYIPGGDLMSLLIKKGIFEESLARFYIAELTCAVESVHKMGFIHRDIKPDNILIDRDGHIKLTDFGLCTGFRWTHNSKYYQQNGEHNRQDSMEPMDALEDWSTGGECRCHQLKPLERRRRREHQRCLAHSLVGTPNYIAPEVLQRIGYTQLCDWWSVGVILYEMLVGSPPFLANTPAETQYKVINWETTLHIPIQANLSKESKDLILKLCVGADKRIGKNANEVKAHPFFKNIDFDKGLRTQIAPYIPRIDFPTDTSNFDPVDPDKLRNSLSNDKSNDDFLDTYKPFHGFFEFTFRRFFDDGGGPAFANKITLDDNENQGPVYV